MNRDTKLPILPSLIDDLLTAHGLQVDNFIAAVWTKMHITTLLYRAGLQKCSGIEVSQVVYRPVFLVQNLRLQAEKGFSRNCSYSALLK